MHVFQEQCGCSISGALKWNEENLKNKFMRELESQMYSEMSDELGILRTEAKITPLGFARELERGGKPQFFFNIWTDENKEALELKWKEAKKSAIIFRRIFEEYSKIYFWKVFRSRNHEKAVFEMKESLKELLMKGNMININDTDLLISEELRANLYYLLLQLIYQKEAAFPRNWF